MKEKVTARNLWRGIYPILFFQGTAIVIQNILMITLSVMSANSKYTGISQYSDRVNKINFTCDGNYTFNGYYMYYYNGLFYV